MTKGVGDDRQSASAPRGQSMPVTIGFVPLLDAALLVVAREEGFAEQEGIDLTLVRENSWAAVRDKLNVGLFDAAHMLAPAAIASVLGIGHLTVPLIAPVALNLDGNAITISHGLAAQLRGELGSGTVATPALTAQVLSRLIARRAASGGPPLTIGVVFGFSSHLYQIQTWLRLGGIDPETAVRFVVIPPPLMVESLGAGLVDMFCAGAPWNRMAEAAGAGLVLHPCAEIIEECPEKLLVIRDEQAQAPWATGLVRMIARAAVWTSDEQNRALLARHLARPDYIGAPVRMIEEILSGHVATAFGETRRPWIRLDPDATKPTLARVRFVFDLMDRAGHISGGASRWHEASTLARPDLYELALHGPPSGR